MPVGGIRLRPAVELRARFASPLVGVGSNLTVEGSDVVVYDGSGEPGSQQFAPIGIGFAQPSMLKASEVQSDVEQSGSAEDRPACWGIHVVPPTLIGGALLSPTVTATPSAAHTSPETPYNGPGEALRPMASSRPGPYLSINA